ncbi:hypothetical protein K2173_022820 [Erythroxylum novogranatense]|uniref:LOB domain-containing protein n=1 Tax=Erythroxylum novogranatense TaxID=1862640 RepID=A0AAV8SNP3_9ROSI|nr:hypothetical protein K2173_022820 [Erythroxylum novogranatense]
MTLKGGTGQACAACKHQRKRCTSECILAPYFPADKHEMFRNAHKLFGVSNIVKILKSVDDSQKAEAMTSIIFQSNIRDRYPVHGCLGMIHHLRYQIWQTEQELQAVLAQLEMYRQHHHQHHISSIADDVPSQLELGMAPPGNALQLFGHNTQAFSAIPAMPVAQQQPYSNSNNYSSSCLDSKDNAGSSMWVQHPCAINNNPNSMGIHQPHSVVPEPLDIQQEIVQDYNEIQPFFDTIDDRQSYVDSREEYDCQRALAQLAFSEESLKDTTQWMEDIAENELKSAAACFTLTSVN